MDFPSWVRETFGLDNPQKNVGLDEERTRYVVVSETAPQLVHVRVVGRDAPDLHNEYRIVRDGPMYDRYQQQWLSKASTQDDTVYELTMRPANEERFIWVLVGWRTVGELDHAGAVYDERDSDVEGL